MEYSSSSPTNSRLVVSTYRFELQRNRRESMHKLEHFTLRSRPSSADCKLVMCTFKQFKLPAIGKCFMQLSASCNQLQGQTSHSSWYFSLPCSCCQISVMPMLCPGLSESNHLSECIWLPYPRSKRRKQGLIPSLV